jgi:hypothetical protein
VIILGLNIDKARTNIIMTHVLVLSASVRRMNGEMSCYGRL